MATVSAWGKPGAWALDAEENEAELLAQHKQDSTAGNGHSSGGAIADFPSLSAAASTKTKKKKPQTLSLQEFTTYRAAKAAAQPKDLTPDELMALPTGPRERSAEELDRSRLGGGFRSYGGGMRDRDEQPRRQGSFNRDSDLDFAPSRADETDNWATGKKSSIGGGFERRERGDRGDFFSDSQSKADEVDNWASKKSFVPSETRRYERRGSFGLESNGGADSGNWSKRKDEEGGRRIGGAFDSLTERRGVFDSNGVDSESWGRKREEGTGNGSRPKLNLQPRTKPLAEEQKNEFSSEVKPKGSSPFGAARPREEVLKEKGQDWKEIEEKLESAKIKDASVGAGDGPGVAKRGFWGGNARERFQQEDKSEKAWRNPDSVDSHPQSAAGSENGCAENVENGHAEEAEDVDAKM